MAPKSSEGEKKDGISNEPMETCTGVATSLLGKRKVETSDTGEGEDDGGIEEDEEDSDSNWDKDSFEGREYHSSEDTEYSDEDLMRRSRFQNRTVIETKGFFEASENFAPIIWSGIGTVCDLDDEYKDGLTVRDSIGNIARVCVEKYNRKNKKNVKLEHVVRANFNPGGRTKYYITFAARESESPNAPLVEYQAKAVWCAGDIYPILCRPSPPPMKVEYDGKDN